MADCKINDIAVPSHPILGQALEGKECLLILDGVWSAADAEPFVRAINPRRRLLITTRNLEVVGALGARAQASRWTDDNPACELASPKVNHSPTMPFDSDQMVKILAACEKYGMKCRGGKYGGPENARRIKAFVLLLRHSGLRIGDAVTLGRGRITGDKLFPYTAKTGTPVYVPLPDFVLTALEAAPKINEQYFFWSGESKGESARVHEKSEAVM